MRILHILDCSNYIYVGTFRNVNAVRGVRESDGDYIPNKAPIGGVTYMADNILNILSLKDNDIILAWDRKPTNKQADYLNFLGFEKEYKGQRSKNFDVFKQKTFAENVMRECRIPCAALEGYEADDLIYSLWKRYHDEYDYIRIHTEDSDLAFMVDEKTEIIPVKNGGRHIVVDNYNITLHKNQIIPYNMSILDKVVRGDQSDNIPGLGDYKDWIAAIKYAMKDLCYDMKEMGDIQKCREVLQRTVVMFPQLPNAPKALNILSLVTPYLVSLEEVDEPGNAIVDIQMLKSVSGLQRPAGQRIEDLLAEYLYEFNS
jgi:hypothetical protein